MVRRRQSEESYAVPSAVHPVMTGKLHFLTKAEFWKELVIMTLGLMVGAAAVYYFLMPGNLIIGSISGLAMVVNSLLLKIGISLKVSVLILVFNALLLVLAYIFLGPEIGFKTIFASLLLGPFIDLWELICPYSRLIGEGMTSVMGDPWLDLCAYVLLLGASQAFLFRINASTGGIDIISLIMNRRCHMDIGTAVTISGAVVCATAFLIHPFRIVVIGLIGTWINGVIVDYFTASINNFHRSSRCATIALSGSRHILDMSISFSRNLYILNNSTNNFCLLFIADIQLNYLGSSIFCFRLLSLK